MPRRRPAPRFPSLKLAASLAAALGLLALNGDGGGDSGASGELPPDPTADKGATGGADGDGGGGAAKPAKVEFTPEQQAHIDEMFKAHTAKTAEKTAKQVRAEIEAEAKKAKLDETERAKVEAAEAKAKLEEERAQLNAERLAVAAERAALAAKTNPDRVAAVLKLADLSDVEVTDGKVDDKALAKAIDKVLTDFPEFKAGAIKAGASGGDHGAPGKKGHRGDLTGSIAARMAAGASS